MQFCFLRFERGRGLRSPLTPRQRTSPAISTLNKKPPQSNFCDGS